MSPIVYHIAHLVGLILLFVGVGGLLGPNGGSKSAAKYHGIGLLILLVAGFGMIAKLKLSYTAPWVIGKLVIFLVLGFLPVLAKRRALAPTLLMWVAILLGAVAAYLGYLKPGSV